MHLKKLPRRRIFFFQHYTNYFYSSNSQSWRILFFGGDEFSLENLKRLNEVRISKGSNLISTLEVVTSFSETKLNHVQKYSTTAHLPIHSWPYSVNKNEFDVGIVASFGHLIPEHVIDAFPWGIINVHASLLPRWRGSSPIAHAILHGDKETGVTIMKIEPHQFDVGKIIATKSCIIEEDTCTKQLTKKLAKIGADLLLECLKDLPIYMKKSYSQSSDGITKAPKIKQKMALINWYSDSITIYRQYRAISEFFQLQTYFKNDSVKLLEMIPPKDMDNLKIDYLLEKLNDKTKELMAPGQLYLHKTRNVLCIRCKDSWVGFEAITVAGYRKMSPREFYNGFLSKVPHEDRIFKNKYDIMQG